MLKPKILTCKKYEAEKSPPRQKGKRWLCRWQAWSLHNGNSANMRKLPYTARTGLFGGKIMKNNTIGLRIKTFRDKAGWTQKQLGVELTKKVDRANPFTISAVSAWEKGRKEPSAVVAKALAELFGVSFNELTGVDSPKQVKPDVAPLSIHEYELLWHDGEPVYIDFPNMEYRSQWGLIDATDHKIILKNGAIKIGTVEVIIYPATVYSQHCLAKSIHAITLSKLKELPEFYVEVITLDNAVRASYNGWYCKDNTGTCIINKSNGNTLPLSGLSVTYRAYIDATEG